MRYAEALADAARRWTSSRCVSRVRMARATTGCRVYPIQRRTATERGALTYLLKILWFLLKATAMVSVLQLRRRYDLVHVHNVPDFLVYAAWLPRRWGPRSFWTSTTSCRSSTRESSAKAGVAVFRALLRRAGVLPVCGSGDRREPPLAGAVHCSNRRGGECTTILNYPDFSVFGTGDLTVPGIAIPRPVPGLAESPSGRGHRDRGVRDRGIGMPGAEFHIYGDGPNLSMLVRLARELRLEDRIGFRESVGLTRDRRDDGIRQRRRGPEAGRRLRERGVQHEDPRVHGSGVPVIVDPDPHRRALLRRDARQLLRRHGRGPRPASAAGVSAIRRPSGERTRTALEFAVRHGWQARSGEYKSVVDGLLGGTGQGSAR